MPFFFWDSSILLLIPALVFALWAQSQVKGTFARYSRVPASSRRTGGSVAASILRAAGLDDVKVERIRGELSDHYDPRARALRLSAAVHDGYSLAALGVAAHEAGHAIQHSVGYAALSFRNGVLPVARFGSSLAFPLFFIGLIFRTGWMMDVGIYLFLGVVAFQVITLPVELNASSRAMTLLEEGGFIAGTERGAVKKVLNAAAMTYVAATAMAVAQLFRLLMLRGRQD